MAESRSRPRPRPRPKQKVSSQLDTEPSSTLGASLSTSLPASSGHTQVQVQDDDEMFMRNRKRTNKTWEKLEKLEKDTKAIYVESENDEGEGSPPPPRKHKRTDHHIPRWQKDKNYVQLFSVDLSEDSDDDIEILGTLTSKEKHTLKRKRQQRSRSRSITPPPALPLHHLQNARKVVRQTLDFALRPASPTQFDADDSTDTIILDPELARIAQKIASRPHSQSNTISALSSDTADTVTISVKWRPHHLNEAGKEDTWVFKMNKDDNFRDLFEATAEEAAIMTEDLIISYNGKRLYSSVTPKALKIWSEAEFVACDKVTYDYLRKNPLAVPQTYTITGLTEILPDDDAIVPPPATHESDAESESDGDKYKLILRSAITRDITLTVRPSTKCIAIVKAFLKKAGVADKYPYVSGTETGGRTAGGKKGKGTEKEPRLLVDGDKMDNDAEIGVADLEDGDLVEVVGL